ncbi:hypothetical protein [uncultured Mediterranean phage uvMED]|nr:hypothetical protein [uncultured Mediterranean phage uvMED]
MGKPQRKIVRKALQNIEVLPADSAPPEQGEGGTFSMSKEQRRVASKKASGSDSPTPVAATQKTDPPTAVPASGESEMAQTSQQYRRRRARGIRTTSQGVTGRARVERKTLLGQ